MTALARAACVAAATVALAAAGPVRALELRLLGGDGRPLAGARVTVLGRAGSVVADSDGRVTIEPDPRPPFHLFVTRPDGVALKPVAVEALPAEGPLEMHLEAAFSETVTVMTTAPPDLEAPPAGAFTLLGAADLAERRPENLGRVMESLPGATANGNGLAAVPALRGMVSGRTLILLDEGRVTSERRAGASATFLDPTTVEELEVLRGPGSVAYGSDAFGGVIRARTRIPAAGEGTTVKYALTAGAGTDERAAAAEVGTTLFDGGLVVGGSYRRFDDYESPRGTVRDSGGELRGMRAGWQRGVAGGNLRLLWRTDSARKVGKPVGGPSSTRTTYPEESSHRFSASFESPGPGAWSRLAASLFWGRNELVTDKDKEAGATTARTVARAEVRADDWGLRLEAERPVGDGRLVVGVDLSGRLGLEAVNRIITYNDAGCCVADEEIEVSVEDAQRSDLGAFVAVDRRLGAVLLSGGLRADHVRTANHGGWFGDLSTSRTAPSGFLAASLAIAPGLDASLQVSGGFREALLSDRYYRGISGRGFVTGNPELDPETSRQFDLAVRYRREGVHAAVYSYLYRIEDLIERFKQNADYFFRNRGEAELRGVEIEAGVELGSGVSLELGLQAARGEVVGEDAWLDGVPTRAALFTVRDESPSWGWWYARLAGYARDDRPGPTERAVPGWMTVDTGLGIDLGRATKIALIARNLLDHAYLASNDEDAPLAAGRTISLTLQGKL